MRRPSPLALVAIVVLVATAACGSPPASGSPSAAAVASIPPSAGQPSTGAPSTASSSPSTPVATPEVTTTPDPTPSPSPAATASPGPAATPIYESPDDLTLGQCYDPISDPDDDSLLAAILLPCDQPHMHEVFGVAEVAGAPTAPYPGDDDIDEEAVDVCDAAFEEYVGIDFDESRYGYVYYTPSEETWAGGDRAVVCVVEEDGDRITGSIKDTRR